MVWCAQQSTITDEILQIDSKCGLNDPYKFSIALLSTSVSDKSNTIASNQIASSLLFKVKESQNSWQPTFVVLCLFVLEVCAL